MSHLRRSIPFFAGLGLGLYLARAVAEATRIVWSAPALLMVAALAAAAGLGLAYVITWQPRTITVVGLELRPYPQELALRQTRHVALRVFLPLWLYVLWPRQDPVLACGVGLVALIAWGLQVTRGKLLRWPIQRQPPAGWDVWVALVSLAIYLLTLSPGLQPADGGEFQLVAARFGVAHPPGYPLYSTVGGLFVRLPLGSNPAWRLNLFSAITAALTLGLVSRTARRMTGSAVAGLVAALTLGSATTFWATATVASIRPMTAFFAVLSLYALTAPRFTFRVPRFSGPRSKRGADASVTLHVCRPTFLAIALGLGFAHHASLVFLGAVALLYLLLVDTALAREPRRWLNPCVGLALTQLVWLYLPLRDAAGAPLAPGNLTRFDGLTRHILARGFAGDMFAFATPEHLPDRLALLPTLLGFQFNVALLVAAIVGALLLLRRDWRRFTLLFGGFAVHTFVTLTYRAPQTVEYEMPAYVVLALLVGEVGKWAGGQGGRWSGGKSLVVAAVVVAGFLNVRVAWPSLRYLAQRDDAGEFSRSLLRAAPAGAVVMSNWHWATPMWYLQRFEGLRPDVKTRYIAPQGESLAQNWVDAISEEAEERPVIAVRYFEPEFDGLPYRFEPLGPAFAVQTQPAEAMPPHFAPLDVDLSGRIRLLGYAVESGEEQAAAAPVSQLGQPLALNLAWMLVEPLDGEVALFAHLLREGVLVGQGSDQRHAAANNYRPGQVIIDRFLVYPVEGTMPGDVQLAVGAYQPGVPGTPRLTTPGGSDSIFLTVISLRPVDFPPVTGRPMRVPFVDGPTLIGLDWDTTVPSQLRLYLHWQGRSQTTDLDTVIRQGDEIRGQVRVQIPGRGYVSSVYDLPWSAEPVVLTTGSHAIGSWGLARDVLSLPAPDSGERYVPIGGEMVLMEATVDQRAKLVPGDQMRWDLRLIASRPLTRDRTVSVSLVGLRPDGIWAWRDLSDSVPALGAVPTLKWIYGSMVLDRHRLTVPDDAPNGLAQARLQVYDSYTQAVLPPLDSRLLREGLSIPLHTWTVEERSKMGALTFRADYVKIEPSN